MELKDGDLAGRRVLVVEDESLLSMFIQDMLADMGCEVIGVASRFEEAAEKAGSLSYDVAILDVNLAGQPSFPIAETIAGRRMPFVLATGYGLAAVPQSLKAAPCLQKPFLREDLENVLRAVFAPAGRSAQTL